MSGGKFVPMVRGGSTCFGVERRGPVVLLEHTEAGPCVWFPYVWEGYSPHKARERGLRVIAAHALKFGKVKGVVSSLLVKVGSEWELVS